MDFIAEPFRNVRDFLEAGGLIVQVLLVVALILWAMIFERALYYWRVMPTLIANTQDAWSARTDHSSWYAKKVKEKLLAETSRQLAGSVTLIKAVVALCPLLGLLGTVTGMIQVFEVMAALGTGNARAMAAGVSAATLPTMSGMVLALSGLYPISRFEHIVDRELRRLGDHMITH
ncbi:MotA/TolQ/ExbB proton channel family protein [Algiphilus sp. W345]|uniref:MotA/TolQ/ExbB proton channel family protein n=1 Tax=Banduia mediterranea TaxID=3075609 RepID=A0ABU2WIU4_9GAMM|nr:MotA/TolQ/ExbB proton channel family protein [Algiphilus sp. W345]MDT0497793.1 MotA/TolQ/ExbB proton channel family protein [Algiphilus sp. W345]